MASLRFLNNIPKGGACLDHSDLRGRIRARYRTQAIFAEALGISECALSQKLNGHTEWTAGEIRKAGELLAIPAEELHLYFFYLEC